MSDLSCTQVVDAIVDVGGDFTKLSTGYLDEMIRSTSRAWAYLPWYRVWVRLTLRWVLRDLVCEHRRRWSEVLKR